MIATKLAVFMNKLYGEQNNFFFFKYIVCAWDSGVVWFLGGGGDAWQDCDDYLLLRRQRD